jgi:hypothetical protein
MLLEPQEKIHVITRRNFEDDLRRHFVGLVVSSNEVAARIEGYVFVFDPNTNTFVRRTTKRTRIVSLTDTGNLINILPPSVNLERLIYETRDGRLVVTDGGSFSLDINEFGRQR